MEKRQEKILVEISESDNKPLCLKFTKEERQLLVGVVEFDKDGNFELTITNKTQKGKKILLDFAFTKKYGYDLRAAKFILTDYKFVDKDKCVILMPIRWKRSTCFHKVEYSKPAEVGAVTVMKYVDDRKYHMFVKGIDQTPIPDTKELFKITRGETPEKINDFKNKVVECIELTLEEKENILKFVGYLSV